MATLGTFHQVYSALTSHLAAPLAPKKCEALLQWVLFELTNSFCYPSEWLQQRCNIIQEYSPPNSSNYGKISLTTNEGEPYLWIVVAPPEMIEEAENHLKQTLLSSSVAGLGICTDGQNTKYIRRRFDTDKCDYISYIESFTPSNAEGMKTKQPLSLRDLQQFSVKAENLFFQIHSLIRDIDGLHADDALDELCKIIYTKLYDEETTLNLNPYRMQKNLYSTNEELAASVRSLFFEATKYDLRVFSLKIPGYTRSRGVFNIPLRLSSSALVKIIEVLQDYSISSSEMDIKGRAFQKVYTPSVRAGMGQYFTPVPVIDFMVRIAKPSTNDLILDPFCGSGHFLSACLNAVKQSTSRPLNNTWFEFAFGKLHGIEKSDRMVRIAMTDMRLHGDGHSNIRCTDALLPFSNYVDIQPNSFDLILTNPPFGSLLSKTTFSQLGDFELLRNRKSIPLEILGLERCLQFLRAGGKLGIVLPDGILGNQNTSYVRTWLRTHCKIRAIISLPIETFAPYGANIKTSILFATKWKDERQKDTKHLIFLGRSDMIGYDASGKRKGNSDLEEVALELENFLLEEGW